MGELKNPYRESYLRLLGEIGKAGLNALYPNDFEVYLCALELADSQNRTVESFIFPVNPSSLEESNINIINIQKSSQGISVMKTSTFIPVDISLSGDFGRKFKFLLGRGGVDASAISFTTFVAGDSESTKPQEFSSQVKTGYGCIKILDRILSRSNNLDDKSNPYRLYFYNLAFGTSYLVEFLTKKFKQDMSSNMIWRYDINLKAIAPLKGNIDKDPKKLTSLTSTSIIQKGINSNTKLLDGELKRHSNLRAKT